MKKDLVEIVLVVDRSGSMRSIREDAEGGVNSLIDEQKKVPGEANVTLVQFDAEIETVMDAVPIQEAKEYYLMPGGRTALFDAVGSTIQRVGERLAAMPEAERPEKVLFVIVTDGFENASREYTRDMVRSMIDLQTKEYNWEFQFQGTTEKAVKDAVNMGIQLDCAMQYAPTSKGVRKAYGVISQRLMRSRVGSS